MLAGDAMHWSFEYDGTQIKGSFKSKLLLYFSILKIWYFHVSFITNKNILMDSRINVGWNAWSFFLNLRLRLMS